MTPSPSSASAKRGAEAPTSPPPAKRKIQSGTTKSAVASFFTPSSQKPKDKTIWTERAPDEDTPETLLVGRYEIDTKEDESAPKRRKIAAFDLDGTLITPASGKKHADNATDWKWWDSSIPTKLKSLYNDKGYRVVIISNQGGIKLRPDPNPKTKTPKALYTTRLAAFKQKCTAVLTQLDIPTAVYAATGRDAYRKPRTGIWKELCEDFDLEESEVDIKNSFYVGDAGGRLAEGTGKTAVAKDFSCSDRNFAENLGVRFKTPEEYFLGEEPREFKRDFDLTQYPFSNKPTETVFEKKSGTELVIFCGPPGAGKSTFYWRHLKPLGYERVNQDTLKSRDKCVQAARGLLEEGDSVVVDNTNPDVETRAIWVEVAKKNKVPIRCVWFNTPIHVCEHNDAVRSMNSTLNPESREGLPKLAFNAFASRYREPALKEGFEDIVAVDFRFRGTKEEYDVWSRHWL